MKTIVDLVIRLVVVVAINVLSPAVGYFLGWLFGLVFDDTWASMKLWLGLPSAVTSGMFFAFVYLVGSMFQTPRAKG